MPQPNIAGTPIGPPATRAELSDVHAWLLGCAKLAAGKSMSRDEERAWKRHEKRERERHGAAAYEAIPKKLWEQWSGRQRKVLAEQAERYGIPFANKTINLPAVVKALHDFLARNARRLLADPSGDALLSGEMTPALEQYRRARARLAELELEARKRSLLPRDEVHDRLARVAVILRGAGEAIRKLDQESADVLDQALGDFEREIEDWMAGG